MSTDKPDLTRIWAGSAPGANVLDPDVGSPGKFAQGWEAELPPFEYFNFLQKLFTEALAHINEQGIAVWDTDTTYPIGAIVKASDGKLYTALVEQAGNTPVGDATNWKVRPVINDAGTSLLELWSASKIDSTINSRITAATPDATTSIKGLSALATNAETIAGTNTTKNTTPAGVNAAIVEKTPNGTTTTKGLVELATNSEAIAGTDTSRPVVPSALEAWSNSKRFTSSEKTIANGTLVNELHGLGGVPFSVNAVLRCKVSELGYSVGDEVTPSMVFVSSPGTPTTSHGVMIYRDSTRVGATPGSNGVIIYNKTTGAHSGITNGNWRIVLRAEK